MGTEIKTYGAEEYARMLIEQNAANRAELKEQREGTQQLRAQARELKRLLAQYNEMRERIKTRC